MSPSKPPAETPAAASAGSDALAAAVRRRRRELGLTQIQVGRFAGCGPDFIYDLEAGKPTVRLDKTLAVLGVLGLELRLAEGKRGLAVDDAPWEADPWTVRLGVKIEEFRKLEEESVTETLRRKYRAKREALEWVRDEP